MKDDPYSKREYEIELAKFEKEKDMPPSKLVAKVCDTCQRKVAGESQWRAMAGWVGYSFVEDEWCLYPDQCKAAKEYRDNVKAKLDELDAVKAVLRNHNLCGPDCTPAKHIEGVYADLQLVTNELRQLKGKKK